MARIMLIHWKPEEANAGISLLRKAGFAVELHGSTDGMDVRGIRAKPPDAIVIDLTRLPSHGRAVAGFFRETKATRNVPIVFAGGAPDKIERTRKEFPDATFAAWEGIGAAIKKAMARSRREPPAPKPAAGYSGTPLPKKLGVDGDRSVILLHAPKGFENVIRDKDGGQRIRRGGRGQADVVIWFVKQQGELKRRLAAAKKAIADGGALWIAWPKKASGIASDLSEGTVRAVALAAGLVDYKVCAIDGTWSGLKFARRR